MPRSGEPRTRLRLAPKNSVGAKQLKGKSVTTGKIANGAVNGSHVADKSLTGEDINLNALGTVPSASNAAQTGNAGTITGHQAACPRRDHADPRSLLRLLLERRGDLGPESA